MNKVDLNYSNTYSPYPLWIRLFSLFSAICLLATVLALYKKADNQLTRLKVGVENEKLLQTPVAATPAFKESLSYAEAAKNQLNFSWLNLLTNLEKIKLNNPNITLLKVTPNVLKFEVTLLGEAESFDDIVKFIGDLRANPTFSDAELVSQYLVEDLSVAEMDRKPIYTFNLRVIWRL